MIVKEYEDEAFTYSLIHANDAQWREWRAMSPAEKWKFIERRLNYPGDDIFKVMEKLGI